MDNDTSSLKTDDSSGRKANLLHRFIARFIDILIAIAFYTVIPTVGFWMGLTYIFIADGFWNGRSVGKKLLGLRVLNETSLTVASFKDSIIRNAPFAVGFFMLPIPYIGWLFLALILTFESLMALGSSHGKRIGDELAGTHVSDMPAPPGRVAEAAREGGRQTEEKL